MSTIRQADIYPGAISFTRSSSFSTTSTVAYAQSNLTKTGFAIGTVQGMGSTDPIAIKEFGTTPNTDWSDEQDWTVYNQTFTTDIQVPAVSAGVIVDTHSTNASISIGDLVGVYGAGSWSTSGVLSVARQQAGGAGSQSASFVAGASNGASLSSTELFNGSSWSDSGVLSIVKGAMAGLGSTGAGLVAGGATVGNFTNVTELFNGSSWSTSGVLSAAKNFLAGAGSQSSGLIAGGQTSGGLTNVTELFNGSTWTTSGVLSIVKYAMAGAGSQNASFVAGGFTGTVTNATEFFNGSSWSTSGVLSIAKQFLAGAGSQNAGLVAGGVTNGGTMTNLSELFNGSTWTTNGVISIAKQNPTGGGSQSSGLIAGGQTTAAVTNVTELHNQTLYRKLTNFANYKCAKNIGIAFDVTSTTLSVKFQGYVDNINVTSSNLFVTASAATWVNQWVVFPRFSPNQSITDNPASIVVKSSIEADDLLVGRMISRTQMQVFSGNLFAPNNFGRW